MNKELTLILKELLYFIIQVSLITHIILTPKFSEDYLKLYSDDYLIRSLIICSIILSIYLNDYYIALLLCLFLISLNLQYLKINKGN